MPSVLDRAAVPVSRPPRPARRGAGVAKVVGLTLAWLALSMSAALASPSEIEAEIARKLHTERERAGVGAVIRSADLDDVARRWSQQQAADGRMAHNPSLRDQVGDARAWYENVGVRSADESAAASGAWLHDAWMASDGHRANILRSPLHDVGIGVAVDGRTVYATVVFRERTDGGAARVPAPEPAPEPEPEPEPAPEPDPPAPESSETTSTRSSQGEAAPVAADAEESPAPEPEPEAPEEPEEPAPRHTGPPTSIVHSGTTAAPRDEGRASDRRRAALRAHEEPAEAVQVAVLTGPDTVARTLGAERPRPPSVEAAATPTGIGGSDVRDGSPVVLASLSAASVALALLGWRHRRERSTRTPR